MTVLQNFLIRWRARSDGMLRNSALFSEIVGWALLLRAMVPGTAMRARLNALVTAARRLRGHRARRRLGQRLSPLLTGQGASAWRSERIGLERYLGDFADISDRQLTASLVLKTPGADGEKGVLYSSFEYNWMRIVRSPRAKEFFADWYLVGASSWSPPDYASFFHLAGLSDDPVFIGISNLADLESYRVAAPVIEPLPLMACDWINPSFYEPRARDHRSVDILMVANWLPFKRHWLLFRALSEFPRNARIVLVGRNAPGRNEDTLRREARAFGVQQDLELYTDIGIEQVTALQCDAKISAVFSEREGSCVAPVESFFANSPVAMMNDAHVGSRAYINPQTGVLLSKRDIGRQLRTFWEERDNYSPREWAMHHVTCHTSSRRLNEILRTHAERTGARWTRDIVPLCWRYMPSYVHESDHAALAPAFQELHERFDIAIKGRVPSVDRQDS